MRILKNARSLAANQLGNLSKDNRVVLNLGYSDVQSVSEFNIYHIETITKDIDDIRTTTEFSPIKKWPLCQYLECRRKEFFASSCYFIKKSGVVELDIFSIAQVAFDEQIKQIYFMRLTEFIKTVEDYYDEFAERFLYSVVLVVDGKEECPTEDTLMITKIFDIQSGV